MVSNLNIQEKIINLKTGKLTCVENVKHFLANIEKKNEKYNIFLEINKNALREAEELDNKRMKGEEIGDFFGLVFGIKPNISTKDMTISCASKTLENYKGTFDADVVQKIKEEDGIIIGMVNCDEFASGSSGENSAFGPTTNPKSPLRIPGGSSSGAAAAIAADMCDISLATDTGGSIRNPASHCGIVGIKPSYGRVSRYGLVDLGMSLDQIGPFSEDIYGSAYVLSRLAGKSEKDSISFDKEVPDYTLEKPNRKYKIGIIKEFKNLIDDERIQDILDNKVNKLNELGHEVIEISMNAIDLAIQAYYPIVYAEFYSGTRKLDGVKYGHKVEDTCGPEALRRILGGKEISKSEYGGAYYKKSLKVKEIISSEFERVFKEVDFILTPVTPMLPHKYGTKLTAEQMYAYDAFTIPANLAGICGGVISRDIVKEGDEDVYVGVQVLADKFREDLMFQGLNLLDSLK